MRFMHALLATTLSGRAESRGVVETHDIFYLHSMVDREPIDIGYCLAQFIARKAASLRTRSIWTGPYITRLLRGMGLLPEELERQFTFAERMVPFDAAMMRAIHLRRVGAGLPAVVEPRGEEDDEEDAIPQEEQPEDMGGPGDWTRLERQLAQMETAQQSFYASQVNYNREQAERLQNFIAYQEAQNQMTHDQLQQLIGMMGSHFGIGSSSSQFPPPPGSSQFPPPS